MQLGVCDSRGLSHAGEPKDAHARFQPIAGVRSHAHAHIRMLAFTLASACSNQHAHIRTLASVHACIRTLTSHPHDCRRKT
eukprot:2900230-Pleurochrysis_carterae.AAC.1